MGKHTWKSKYLGETVEEMKKSIDLYVRPKKKMITIPESETPSYCHTYKYKWPQEIRKSTTKHLSEAEKATIKFLEDFSEEKNILLSIHTIITHRDALRARLKGIKETPVTVIGNQKIIGIPTLDEIEKILGQ